MPPRRASLSRGKILNEPKRNFLASKRYSIEIFIVLQFILISNSCEQMKPYLNSKLQILLRSDVIETGTKPNEVYWDPVSITGTIRMTYVDN